MNEDFHDGYGNLVQRSNACYDENKFVIIKIIDRWACWCCVSASSAAQSSDCVYVASKLDVQANWCASKVLQAISALWAVAYPAKWVCKQTAAQPVVLSGLWHILCFLAV